jgi:hypothetical protein
LKELAVRPKKFPFGSLVVMTVTPVANWDNAVRKWLANSGDAVRAERVDI